MTTPQENKLSMYIVVRDFFTTNSATAATLPAFAAGVTRFKTELIALHAAVLAQDGDSTGTTADKAAKKETIARLGGDMASLIAAYAMVTGDAVIQGAAAVTYTDILRARDVEAPDIAERVRRLATDHAAALADYGVTAASITALGTAITAFRAVQGAPREIIAGGSAGTEEVEEAFVKVDAELEILDRLSAFFRGANPSFLLGYEAARVIVDHAATRAPEPAATPVP